MKKNLYRIVYLLFIFLLTGCSKTIPFAEKNKLTFSDLDITMEAPVYFYTRDADGQITKFDDIKFVPHNMTYHYHDFQMSDSDKDGNVIVTFTCDMTTSLEYRSSHHSNWYPRYSYLIPSFLDYYTGIYYRGKIVSSDNSTQLYGVNPEEENEMKYTTIKWGKQDYSIGIYSDILLTKGEKVIHGVENGAVHAEVPIMITMKTQIKVPKDFDGVLIAIEKEGVTEEKFLDFNEKDEKLLALQQEAKKNGEKSEELIKIEKEMNEVSKIDLSKEKASDYYFLRVSDAFPFKEVKQFPITIVIICLVTVVVVGVVYFIFIKSKKQKAYTKKKTSM